MPFVKVEFEHFRDPNVAKNDQDFQADAAEIDAAELALKAILTRLELLYAKSRPPFEPPDIHS